MSDLTNTFRVFFPSSTFRASGLIAVFTFLICLFAAQSAQAQLTLTVTRTDDRNTTCVSGDCSLREAVAAANAAATNDTINFAIPAGDAGCTSGVCTITLASEISIANNGSLTVNGTGARSLIIDGGAGTNRILFSNLATFNLSGVTLTGGGGTGATLSGFGGAILANRGTTTISGVYFNANTGARNGGGIYFRFGTNHRVENSTFSGNTASGSGGGIYVEATSLTVVNTTLTGNTVGSVGGGIIAADSGTLTLRGDTITANTANFGGGGIYRDTGTLDFGNTIIAGNTGTSDLPEIYFFNGGTATSRGFNLVGDSAGDSTANNGAITYQPTDIQDTPPLLDPLDYYGGTTPTRRLQTGSPAIDKGFSFTLTTDRRGTGFARPVDNPSITNATNGDGSDIGAFEVQAPTAATVSVGGRVLTMNGRGIMNVRLSLTDSSGQVRTATTTSFGYYRFDDVQAGETYILSASGKHYTFSQPLQVLNINGETDAVDFIANSEKRLKSF